LFRLGLTVAGPFVRRCLNSLAVSRFHSPLIEPDRRISRIRLSDKNSRLRTREAALPALEPHQTHSLVKSLVGVS
jgi:hypothetical protein